ncbi:MAG: hypothetical protein IJA31_00655 [Clostridia bacterium]|nr:hypothetical protein [Clostridia bacterium]
MSENKNDSLQNEMENLAETFRNVYAETASEAEEHPLIQELEEIVEEDEEEEETPVVPEKKKEKKKKEKKKASAIIGSIISFLLVIVLMFVTAGISFYASSFTELDSYIYSVKCAESVEDVAAKTEYYKEALNFLKKDIANMPSLSAVYADEVQRMHELIAVCTVETEGYAAAIAYMNSNLTEAQIASPLTAEFKAFEEIAGVFETLAAECLTKVEAAGADADFAALAATYTTDETLSAAITAILENIAKALEAEEKFAFSDAGVAYEAAIAGLAEYSTKSPALAERNCICIAYTKGYAAALSYAKSNITGADYTPVTEEYAAFLAAADVFAALDNEQFNAVSANVATFTDAADEAVDVSGIVSALNIPECLYADAETILTNLARAVISENTQDSKAALDYYKAVAENLTAIGQKGTLALEKIAVLTAEVEDLHAAYVYVAANSTLLAKDAESALTEDFATLLTTLDGAFSAEKVAAFIENAKNALAAGSADSVNLDDVIALSNIDPTVADFYKAYFAPLAEAMDAEKEKNLTLAVTKYQELATLLADDNVALPNTLLEGIISSAFYTGDLQTAATYCTNYVDVEALADSEFKTLCEAVQLSDAAMQKASAVMQQAYYSSYYGTVPTFEEVSAQFDALLTEDSNKYDEAFNYYNRFVCEIYFFAEDEASPARQTEYLEKVRELIPEQIFIYGYSMLQLAVSDGDYDAAKTLADEMLAVNAYDDIALSILASVARMEGDLETAASYVAKGLAYENESYECERQNIILCMLNGKFADAYDNVVALYTRGLATMTECETIAVYAALFADADDTQKAKLDEIVKYIENDLYGAYGYTYSENTKALIDGTKTLNDVFMAEPYDLW